MSKPIVVKSSDGETFEIDEAVASQSQIIKYMIEDGCADTVIPLPNVTGRMLSKVIEYCKKHACESEPKKDHDAEAADDLKKFDTEFILSLKGDDDHPIGYIAPIYLAAHYLDIEGLLLLCRKTLIRDFYYSKNHLRTPESSAKFLRDYAWAFDQSINPDIVKHQIGDMTPEEEAKIRRENAWAFE